MAGTDLVFSNRATISPNTPGQQIPLEVLMAETEQGMGSNVLLGPGAPIAPTMGYREARSQDYRTAYNVAARPRSQERVAFSTLKGLIGAYDLASTCIEHRIASIRALEWRITPMEGYVGNLAPEINFAKQIMRKPDGRLPFGGWLHKYLYDVLAYDAGALLKTYNNAGQIIPGLKVLDGTTIAPLLDEYGDTPIGDAPAYVQYIQGINAFQLFDTDLIYQPYSPVSDSPYGLAPLERMLLNANTDLRFQAYFLNSFTAGNVPEGFAIAPESWTPQQLKDYQEAWDALMYGDEAIRSQMKWIPGGTKLEFPNIKAFDPTFSMFLMQKTMAAFHITPSDLGFVNDVNRANGEVQTSVAAKVGDIPLGGHVHDVISDYLQNDLGLPLEFKFDTGKEEEDRLATAQADKIYVDMAVVSLDYIAELRFGISPPDGKAAPRYIASTKEGPIPLGDLLAIAGDVDAETGSPIPGTMPAPLAPAEGITSAVAPPPVPVAAPDTLPMAKAIETSFDAEIGAYRRFAKARVAKGSWRDFDFATVDPVTAHRLNSAGYGAVRKDAGEIVAAGVAVLAADTGRVLLLQRRLDQTDPASGMWEFPGGCLEPGESASGAAIREWAEEVGHPLPAGELCGQWTSGVYSGFVYRIAAEADVSPFSNVVGNPDDPDGDCPETVAWWAPASLAGNPVIRAELVASLPDVLATLNAAAAPPPVIAPPEGDAVPLAEPVTKSWRDSTNKTPQHAYDIRITDHYAPLITASLLRTIDQIGIATIATHFAGHVAKDTDQQALVARINTAIAAGDLADPELRKLIASVGVDGYQAGAHAAAQQITSAAVVQVTGVGETGSVPIDWDNWVPGNTAAAEKAANGGMRALLDEADITVEGIDDSTLDTVGNRIASGLAAGDPSDKIERDIRDQFEDPMRADRIAHTETTRAVISATMDVYDVNGITEWDMIVSDGACPACLDVEAGNPHKLGDTPRPPVHPFCRCSTSPNANSVSQDSNAATIDDGSTIASDEGE
jgi:8-oxo-dGTP pyrophosphatase MutT (NUDIX family)